MIIISLAERKEDLLQVHQLNKANLKGSLDREEREREGFLTWLYELPLLEQLHEMSPAVLAKEGEKVVGYALAATPEAAAFHPDLAGMIAHVNTLPYKGRPLGELSYYIMGQICIHKAYRGLGLFGRLYQKHRDVYGAKYSLLVTEVSAANLRSCAAHQKTGFETIAAYTDAYDTWNVVVWDWQQD